MPRWRSQPEDRSVRLLRGSRPIPPRRHRWLTSTTNNNYQAPMLPGPLANPTPGTIVVHFNGKVQVDFRGTWTSADTSPYARRLAGRSDHQHRQPARSATRPRQCRARRDPAQWRRHREGHAAGHQSFARLYLGADGMATNGLRYGAAIEVRAELHWSDQSGASAERLLVAGDTVCPPCLHLRGRRPTGASCALGQADGVIGIFDNGVTTFQFLPTGNLNGGDLAAGCQSDVAPPFCLPGRRPAPSTPTPSSVYMSPQIAGFDFGFQYAPNTSNGFGIGASGGGIDSSLPAPASAPA